MFFTIAIYVFHDDDNHGEKSLCKHGEKVGEKVGELIS